MGVFTFLSSIGGFRWDSFDNFTKQSETFIILIGIHKTIFFCPLLKENPLEWWGSSKKEAYEGVRLGGGNFLIVFVFFFFFDEYFGGGLGIALFRSGMGERVCDDPIHSMGYRGRGELGVTLTSSM